MLGPSLEQRLARELAVVSLAFGSFQHPLVDSRKGARQDTLLGFVASPLAVLLLTYTSRSIVGPGTHEDRSWPALAASLPRGALRGLHEQSAVDSCTSTGSEHRLDQLAAVAQFVRESFKPEAWGDIERRQDGQLIATCEAELSADPHVAMSASMFSSCSLANVGNLIPAIQEILEVIKVGLQDSMSNRIVD